MPKLHIHFTDRDLARTRMKLETDLLWEIVGSAQILHCGNDDLAFGPWRRRVRELAARDVDLRMALRTMAKLAPHAVLPSPPQRLHRALRVYFRSVIEPHLPVIEDGVRTEVAAKIQRYLHCGPEGLLEVLGPATRWDPPVLSVDHPHRRDVHLDGRGLVLVPCYFALHHQVVQADPQLAYPIRTECRLLAGGRPGGDHVTALLGSTRASILRSVVGGSTTTRLAKLVGVAPATVSHHTGVLREAGLIATEREENFARHLITPLGLRVLAADR
ncbi:ArsR/SmtB family transcription factor [Lentzea flava]|uniref:Transcriptional regulator n=1 Tax=Lentzea flava TaxID=103732 RepID=A0ABQ2UXA4_9PSEU|nr:winged helix-turn-helix domain-containing protein [Lentzea flava]MCP2201968.1 Helix-turn-helix domain-containing protein [Lentzea flava]GGU56597.1 transcriptional regulator [Lentzea flava]